ncbi:MAG: helix-turn-helix domain-containing protein [Planctomycetota bacterium]|jgi:AraC-like DNA-binding protein
MDKHFDGYYTLQYMDQGGIDISFGSQKYKLEGKYFWCHFPGPRIALGLAQNHDFWHHRYLAFSGPLAVRWHTEGLLFDIPQKAPQSINWAPRMDQLLSLHNRTDRTGILKRINLLESILIDLAENRTEFSNPQPWLEYVIKYLENEDGDISYNALAAECNMALSTLRRKFKSSTGVSIHDYVLQIRAARAKDLLINSDKPIKEISAELGFTDTGYFNRQFKKVVGVTPGLYRKSGI